MPRGRFGGPRPFAVCEIVMEVTISIGALDQIEEGKRSVTEREVAEIESDLRDFVMKSFATGPADQPIDVTKSGKNTIKIFLGDKVDRRQIKDIENVLEREGYKAASWTIKGE